MRYLTMAMVVAGLLVSAHAGALADQASLTGELVTTMCFMGNGDKGRGEDHAACALKCAKNGYPLAIVTDDGTMYKITGPLTADKNAKLQGLLAKTVVATGDVQDGADGKTLEASSVVLAQ